MASCKKGFQVVGNVWTALMDFEKAGDIMEGHSHKFTHQTFIACGSFNVVVAGELYEKVKAPMLMTVEAGLVHSFVALEDNSRAICIHPIIKGENYDDIVSPDDMPLVGGKLPQSLIEA